MIKKITSTTILITYIFFLVISIFFTSSVKALEECDEATLRKKEIAVLTCDQPPIVCGPTGNNPIPLGKNTFAIGDSLTLGKVTTGEYLEKLSQGGFSVDTKWDIDPNNSQRVFGYSVEATGGIGSTGTKSKLEERANNVNDGLPGLKAANIVVIALGTNNDSNGDDINDDQERIDAYGSLVSYIRTLSPSAIIYWVNTYYTGESRKTTYAEINSEISIAAQQHNFTAIDYAAGVVPDISLDNEGKLPLGHEDHMIEPDGGDGVHFSPNGYGVRSGYIVKKLLEVTTSQGQPATTSNSVLGLTYPSIENEAAVQSAITTYIAEKKPESPWLTVDENIGKWVFEKAKEKNINPFLVFSIGKQENQFGTAVATSVKKYNYFGMKWTDRFTDPRMEGIIPTDIEGSSYLALSSPEEGLRFFINYLQINTQADNRGPYANVQNFYEYLSMHQAGQIAYPGEPLVGGDDEMDVPYSWDSNWNPKVYFENSIAFMNEVAGLTLSPVPTRGVVVSDCSTSPETTGKGSGFVDPGSGYSFPLAPQDKSINGISVGQTTTTHHDSTAAFDLTSINGAEGGEEVYAIFSGVIHNTREIDPGWCYSTQLKADDGFFYYYTHLNNIAVTKDQRVESGELLGYVAKWESEHTCNGTSSGTHLHIDRGCVIDGVPQTGGRDPCRDPDFIPFLSKLYENLPDNRGL